MQFVLNSHKSVGTSNSEIISAGMIFKITSQVLRLSWPESDLHLRWFHENALGNYYYYLLGAKVDRIRGQLYHLNFKL
jgi:hypothetical protein